MGSAVTPRNLVARGLALHREGSFEDAVARADEALALEADHPPALHLKSSSLLCMGLWDESLAVYSVLRRLDPEDLEAAYGTALALCGQGNPEAAVELLDFVLRRRPGDARPWFNKGAILVQLQRFEEASACLAKALEFNPEDATAWANQGAVLLALGRNQQGRICLERALELDPQCRVASNNLARLTGGNG